MAESLDDQLRSELTNISGEIERLERRRTLIQELLNVPAAAPEPAAPAPASRRGRRRAARTSEAPKRTRRPRGLITGKVREFLGNQNEPAHATQILKFLEEQDAAPQSAKPMPTLQSTLQRMKEMGEIVNTGRNRWRLNSGSSSAPEPAPEPAPAPAAAETRSDGPPVVTSTTTFGSRPLSNQ